MEVVLGEDALPACHAPDVAELTGALAGLRVAVPSASALAQARRRIGATPLRWLFDMLKGPGADVRAAGTRWRGLLVVALDGTSSTSRSAGRGISPTRSSGPTTMSPGCWTTPPTPTRGWETCGSARSGSSRAGKLVQRATPGGAVRRTSGSGPACKWPTLGQRRPKARITV
ncbi:transposase domain-containing protein [Streptomyces sp. PA03-5A]|nr:transposase domain-containing protein [Streptomyces sp. PA03-5A]